MKKFLTIVLSLVLVLVLILGGLFFWKGGHHAIALADIFEQWLDADSASQTLTVQLQKPDFEVREDSGQISPKVRQMELNAESFWTEYADRDVFGVTVQGMTAYICGGNLYMDTGRAYTLPKPELYESARRLALGLLVHGRVTKTGDTYRIDMKTDELELHASVTADRALRTVTLNAILEDGTAVTSSLMPKDTAPPTIPREVTDAMVRAQMEPPMAITEPLEVLLPAAQTLLPLTGSLELGIECGILQLQETVGFSMDADAAQLERKGVTVDIDLPQEIHSADPAVLALLLLRDGTFTREGEDSVFRVALTGETTKALCTALVPQAAELGIEFEASEAVVRIGSGRLSSVSLTADGQVPFLVTQIPVSFHADLTVQ